MQIKVSAAVDDRAVMRALARYGPAELGRRSRRAMAESLAFLQAGIQSRFPADTGVTRAATFTAMRGQTMDQLRGVVANPLAHAGVLEFGRRAGGPMPPVSVIERWAQRKLGASGLGFVIARSIARKGTKPVRMFQETWERGARTVRAIWTRRLGGP